MNLLIDDLSFEIAKDMLIYECDLRKSKEIQELYTLIQTKEVDNTDIIENSVQYLTLEKFGYDLTKQNLKNYRMIGKKFGSKISEYAFYLKYNIMKEQLMPGTILNTEHIKLIRNNQLYDFNNICSTSLIFAGSITWPPFRALASIYNQIYDEYKHKINIFAVYILEAHFVENDLDGWPIGTLYRYPQHKTIEERISMSNKFIEEFDFKPPVYVDTMSDSFNNTFNIWPDKCIIVKQEGNETEILFTALLNGYSRTTSQWYNDITNFIDNMINNSKTQSELLWKII